MPVNQRFQDLSFLVLTVVFAIFTSSRKAELVSYLLPVTVLGILLLPGLLFTSAILRVFFGILLAETVFGAYTDIYMFFFTLRHVPKTDILFGLYAHAAE